MGMIEGAIKREGTDLSEAEMLGASGDHQDNQDGGVGLRAAKGGVGSWPRQCRLRGVLLVVGVLKSVINFPDR